MSRFVVLKNDRNIADISPTPLIDGGDDESRFRQFVLDRKRGSLMRGGAEVPLRPKTFELLSFFVANAGRLISKDELMDSIWPDVVVTEDSLVKCVAELRRAVGDEDHRLIQTVSRRGYRFDPDPVESADISRSGPASKRMLGVYLLLLVLAFAAGAWYFVQDRSLTPPFSIVVLPFETRGVGADKAYIGDGMASDLTADLARLPGFFVIAHATARTFGDENRDARDIGRKLNVRYVLDGSIERTADDVRVNAELVSVDTGAALWTDRFAAPNMDIARSRDEIIGRIATLLNFRVTTLESERSRRERPDSPAAADLTAHGWALVYSAKQPSNYASARALFQDALKHDPDAVNALAGIGWTSAVTVLNDWSSSPPADFRIANDAVRKVLAVEPSHVVGNHVRGFLFRLQKRPRSARDAFRKVVGLNPSFAPGHAQIAVTELELGNIDAVRPAVEKAMRLSPRDPSLGPWLAFVGIAELHGGNPGNAVRWLERAIDTGTPVARHRAYLVSALALEGRLNDAEVVLAELLKRNPSVTIAGLRASARSSEPLFLEQQERLFEGLRMAGMLERSS